MLLTFHAFGTDLDSLIQKLELDSMLTIVLSESNYIKPNVTCCFAAWSDVSKYLSESDMWNEGTKTYQYHYWWEYERWRIHSNTLRESRKELCTLRRIYKLLNLEHRMSLKKAFGYCTLVWMLCSRSSNYCINHLL